MTRKLAAFVLLAFLVTGCTASRAFRHGQDAVHAADWESAVAYFTKAVQENPDSPEYKINLRRAQEELARQHVEKARHGMCSDVRCRAVQREAHAAITSSGVAGISRTSMPR